MSLFIPSYIFFIWFFIMIFVLWLSKFNPFNSSSKTHVASFCPLLTNSMAYGTRRFNAAFTKPSNNPYPEPNHSVLYSFQNISNQLFLGSSLLFVLLCSSSAYFQCSSSAMNKHFQLSCITIFYLFAKE